LKQFKIKDLVVPLSEYAVIRADATLYEAVMALEKAQVEFDHTKYRHRAVLVKDAQGRIVGKLGLLDMLLALEPKYEEMKTSRGVTRFGFSRKFLLSMLEHYDLFGQPFTDLCRQASGQKVSRYMHQPTEGEFIELDDSLDKAVHLLVVGQHQSLLVMENNQIVGILRLTDVFAAVHDAMKACTAG
jgi:CBS domain-containing protein